MKTRFVLYTMILFLSILSVSAQKMTIHKQDGNEEVNLSDVDSITFKESNTPKPKVAIVWTSGDPDVADKMVFMYAKNAKQLGWVDQIHLIIWGPSSKLLSENTNLQNQVRSMLQQGIKIEACKACADEYGVSSKLQSLGVTVKYMGQPLTNIIADSNWKLLTF